MLREVNSMGEVCIKEIQYGQWGNCVEVSNGIIDLVATLDFGPRIIRFGLVGRENEFFEDVEKKLCAKGKAFEVFGGGEWYIYGGHRLWTSPEGNPRSYYPDNQKVAWGKTENGIRLTPEPEKGTQVQKEIEVIMCPDEAKVKVIHRITNTGIWDIEFAPWALSVMAPGGKEVVPQPQRDTGLLGNRILALWPYTRMNDKRVYWGEQFITLRQDPTENHKFKFGLSNEEGWAAYFNHNNLFVKRYQHVQEGTYPDFGVSFETFTNPVMLEIESLGQLKNTAPGETAEHVEEWQMFADVSMPPNDEAAIEAIVNTYIR